MTKITTDFVGNETTAVTKQRLTDILAYWGASTAAYTTWGQARTALNALLTSTTAGTIGATELAGTFLPKINFLNDPDDMIADALFGAGEQGVWLDPSDLTTMFQDAAGTTPVTAPGQPVGLRLDKSKGLVLGSELVTNGDFSNPVTTGWVAQGTTTPATLSVVSGEFSINTAAGNNYPGGSYAFTTVVGRTYRVSLIARTNTTNRSDVYIRDSGGNYITNQSAIGASNTTYNFVFVARQTSSNIFIFELTGGAGTGTIFADNISVKELPGNHATQSTAGSRPMYGIEPKGGRRNLLLATDTLATQSLTVTAAAHTLAFTGTGTVTLSGASTAGPLVGTGAGNRVTLTFTPTAASLTLTVSGSVTLAQLELGSSATNYQKVVTAFDVTEAGVNTCHYCQYDGSDDGMVTNSIDFTATDKMSVFAGVRKGANALGYIVELSTTLGNPGVFNIITDSTGYQFGSNGSGTYGAQAATTYSAPVSNVLSCNFNLASSVPTVQRAVRINGLVPTQTALGSTGAGTFGNYPLYLGRRGGSLDPFNGRDYGIIVTGKLANATAIATTEMWLANKTAGVTL